MKGKYLNKQYLEVPFDLGMTSPCMTPGALLQFMSCYVVSMTEPSTDRDNDGNIRPNSATLANTEEYLTLQVVPLISMELFLEKIPIQHE